MDAIPSSRAHNPYAAHASTAHPAHTLRGNETCIACGYALTGLSRGSPCPECGTPIADAVGPVAATTAGRYCIRCAYALDGLPVDGKCPECATDVALSLREPTLANADPAYLLTLRSGLSFVLNGILLLIIVMISAAFGAALLAAMGIGAPGLTLIIQVLSLAVSAIILFGYWKFTQPDPSQVALETTRSARATIRWTVAAQAAIAVVTTIVEIIPTAAPSAAAGGVGTLLQIINACLTIVGLVLWAVQFFAVMRYTRWLATRVPDYFIVKRTKTYMWLLPVLYIPGALLIGLGPLIALVLYWNLLDRLRKHVKSIVQHGRPARLKKMAPVGA